eukprot:m.76892 g.76892  ORF g.76892 m.76892 type:complete len:1211 (+) comp36007_c0_seq7:1029-4661(+)
MGGLADLGQTIREAILSEELPYDFINRQIRLWHETGKIQSSEVVGESFAYLTPVMITSGSAVGLALLVPLLATFLSSKSCFDRNGVRPVNPGPIRSGPSSFRTALFILVPIVGIIAVVLTGLAIGANRRMNEGIGKASTGISEALPQINEFANSTLNEFRDVTLDDVKSLYESLRDDILGPLPLAVSSSLYESFGGKVESLLGDVADAGLEADQLTMVLTNVNESRALLQGSLGRQFASARKDVAQSVEFVINACNETLNGKSPSGQTSSSQPTANLLIKCGRVVRLSHLLIPLPSLTVTQMFRQLPSVNSALTRVLKVVDFDLQLASQQRRAYFTSNVTHAVRDEVEKSVSKVLEYGQDIVRWASDNFSLIQSNVTSFMSNHLGLPDSQDDVKKATRKYVETYELYRFVVSSLLCAGILVVSVLLVVCCMAGMLYLFDEENQSKKTHFCGRLLLEIYSLDLLMVSLSLIMFALALSVGSLSGETCGMHRNLTEIIDRVIDNASNWNGFPLGRAILENGRYPLKVHTVINECSENESLWTVFRIDERQSLDDLLDFTGALDSKLFSVAEVEPPTANLLGSDANKFVVLLNESGVNEIAWNDCLDISVQSLYTHKTGNFSFLREVMDELSTAAAEKLSSPSHAHIITLLQRQVVRLRHLMDAETAVSDELLSIGSECKKLKAFPTLQDKITGVLNRFETFNEDFNRPSSDPRGASAIVTAPVDEAIGLVQNKARSYVFAAKRSVRYEIGRCKPLVDTYNSAVSSTCNDFLPGTDAFCACILLLALLLMITMFLVDQLALYFLDAELWRQSKKFLFWQSLSYRLCALVWFVLDWGLNIALTDQTLRSIDNGEDAYSAPQALKISVLTFLTVVSILSWGAHILIFILLARTQMSVKATVKESCIFQKKAVQFFSNIITFFLQDIPFLVFAIIHVQARGYANVTTFLSILVSLIGILSFIGNSANQRRSEVSRYFKWLKFWLNPFHWMCTCNGPHHNKSQNGDVGGQYAMEGIYTPRDLQHSSPPSNRYSKSQPSGSLLVDTLPQWVDEPRVRLPSHRRRSASAVVRSNGPSGGGGNEEPSVRSDQRERGSKERGSLRARKYGAAASRRLRRAASDDDDRSSDSELEVRWRRSFSQRLNRRSGRRSRRQPASRFVARRRQEEDYDATCGTLTTADERGSVFWSDDETLTRRRRLHQKCRIQKTIGGGGRVSVDV